VDRPCHRYATIIEPVEGVDIDDHPERSSDVCGRRARRQHVYTSSGHVVHIRLESYIVNPDYFVLSYEGSSASDAWNNCFRKTFENLYSPQMIIGVTYRGYGGTRTPTFWRGGTVHPTFGRMTEKITATFPHPAFT